MAQPPQYLREKNFTDDSGNGTDHSAINAELDRVSNSINDIRFNLAILQADDGRLRPDVVTYDSLDTRIVRDISGAVRADVQGALDRAEDAASRAEAAAASIDITSVEAIAAQIRDDFESAANSAQNAAGSAESAASSAENTANLAQNAASSAESAQESALFAQVNTYENKILNGGFQIDQRNGGVVTSIAANASIFVPDGWQILNSTSQALPVQTLLPGEGGVGSEGCLRVTIPSGLADTHYIQVLTRIEGYDIADWLQGTPDASDFTLSFRVKAPVAGIYSVSFRPKAPPTHSYVTQFEVKAANVEQDVEITVPGCITGGWAYRQERGLQINFVLSAGAASGLEADNINTWDVVNKTTSPQQVDVSASGGGIFELSRVSLVKGRVAKPWTPTNRALEFLKCQRYFQRVQLLDTAYGQAGTWMEASRGHMMRATPTVAVEANSSFNFSSFAIGATHRVIYASMIAAYTGTASINVQILASAEIE